MLNRFWTDNDLLDRLWSSDRIVDAATAWSEATGTKVPHAIIELAAETA